MSDDAENLPPGQQLGPGGHVYMADHRGHLIRIEAIKDQDLLRDQLVRELHAEAERLSAQIHDFVARAYSEVEAFNDMLAERYSAPLGGPKGNLTLTTIDGLKRLLVSVQDRMTYGPELQQAKALIDEYLTEQVAESAPVLQAIVMDAFSVDRAGQINRGALLRLRKYNVADERWARAMDAIAEAETPGETASYLRFHKRPEPKAKWAQVSLDAATA